MPQTRRLAQPAASSFSARPRVGEKLWQALPREEADLPQPFSALGAATAGTSPEEDHTDGQGKARGVSPLKTGMWDQDQLHSTHPLHRASSPCHPDLLSRTREPGHGYPAWARGGHRPPRGPTLGSGLTESHSTSKIHPQQPLAHHRQRGALVTSPRAAASPGAGGQGGKGDTLLQPRDFSTSQGSLCNFQILRRERCFLASSGLQMHASPQGVLNPYSMCMEHMGKRRAPELHVRKGST